MEAVGIFLGDEPGRQRAGAEARVLEQRREKIHIVRNPADLERVERRHLRIDRGLARRRPRDQLGDHRVIEHAHLAAFDHAIVNADYLPVIPAKAGIPLFFPSAIKRSGTPAFAGVTGLGWRTIGCESASRRQKPAIRVLGIDPALDRPAVHPHIVLREGKLLPRRDADHLFDQVEPGHFLGHRMLDLEPGVHLEEVERAIRRDDQLDRPRAIISHRRGEGDRLLAHRLAHFGRDERRRRFLDDLLVAALDRAFALAQIKHRAMLVAEQLDLDMAGVLDEFLDEYAVVAEAAQPLALGRLEPFADIGFAIGQPHPLAPAAGRGLHHHRKTYLACDTHRLVGIGDLAEIARHDRHPRRLGEFLRFDLVAHRRDRLGRRPDEYDPGVGQRPSKTLALGQEAITRMHRLGPGRLARIDDQLGLEIALRRRRRPDPHALVGQPHMRRAGVRV